MIKGIIFDFNGTLLWDTELHNYAWDRFLESRKIKLSDKEKDVLIHGKNNYEIFRLLLNREVRKKEFIKLSEEKETVYRKICIDKKIQLADGCREFFEQCNARNIKISIATSSVKENVDFYIKHFNLLNWFRKKNIIYSNGKIKSKPDPEMFNIAMKKLHVNPEETVVFEDSFTGIKSAENANAGKIIIVNSCGNNFSGYKYKVINSFREITLQDVLS